MVCKVCGRGEGGEWYVRYVEGVRVVSGMSEGQLVSGMVTQWDGSSIVVYCSAVMSTSIVY